MKKLSLCLLAAFAPISAFAENPEDNGFTVRDSIDFAAHTFVRADLDKNSWLDIDEYASLALISAELTRLNQGQFLLQRNESHDELGANLQALSKYQQHYILRRARKEFIETAGADYQMTGFEFYQRIKIIFKCADKSGDNVLHGGEIDHFMLGASWTLIYHIPGQALTRG